MPTRRLIGTCRQRVDVNVSGRIEHIALEGNSSFLDATYESSQTVDGGSNCLNDRGLGNVGRSFAPGNENYLDRPGGVFYLGPPGVPIGAWGGIRLTF
jgi:hypothetical protein